MILRILALTQKELIQIRRDPRTLAMMLLLPLLWLVLFGYAFSFDVSNLKVAVVDESGTRVGAAVAQVLGSYEKFTLVAVDDESPAGLRQAIRRGDIAMAVRVPAGFGDVLGPADGPATSLQVTLDGSEIFSAQAAARMIVPALEPVQPVIQEEMAAQVRAEAQRRLEVEMERRVAAAREQAQALMQEQMAQVQAQVRAQIEKQMQAEVARRQAAAQEALAQVPPALQPIVRQQLAELQATAAPPELELDFQPEMTLPADLFPTPSLDNLNFASPAPPQLIPEVEILYNPDLKSANVMIPGLLGMVTMFMTTLLTALGIVREREFGTMEQLVVTPIRPLELMLGKLLPYVVVAAVDFTLVLLAGFYLFDISVAGNLWLFVGLTLLFLLTTLGLGLLISTVSQNQQQAMQLSFFAMFPQMVLSGFIFPLAAMPLAIRAVACLLPFTYFVPIARGVFLKGHGLEQLWQPALVLAVYGVTMITIAAVRFRKRLG